jgi:synaptic vesicle membrane protein VAT-1
MRALTLTRHGPPEVLTLIEHTTPEPQEGEVRIKVAFAGLNFADVAARVGLYPDAPKPPCVLGYEVSGVVEALGTGVTSLAVGQRVFAMTRFNGQASHVIVPEGQVYRTPDSVSDEAAAALPVNGLTAYHMVHYVAPVLPGMSVLLHSAAGGVGLLVLQLLKAIGGVTVIARASASKHALLCEAGATHCLDSRAPYETQVRELTDGRGVHRVFDALGGRDWKIGYSLLRPAGHMVCFGWANMVSGSRRQPIHVVREFLTLPRYTPMGLMNDNRSVSGVNLGHLWGELDLMRSHIDALLVRCVAGTLAPRIDSVFALAEGAKAHQRLESREAVGKVLLRA